MKTIKDSGGEVYEVIQNNPFILRDENGNILLMMTPDEDSLIDGLAELKDFDNGEVLEVVYTLSLSEIKKICEIRRKKNE